MGQGSIWNKEYAINAIQGALNAIVVEIACHVLLDSFQLPRKMASSAYLAVNTIQVCITIHQHNCAKV